MSFSSTKKYDYIEVVNRGVPEYYRETDYALYGSEEDVSLSFLGKLLKAAIQNDQIFDVSNLDRSGVAEYFIPQGKTYVSPNTFQDKFLDVYGLTLDDFKSDEDLRAWIKGTLFPDIELNNPSGFHSHLSSLAGGQYADLSATHQYCIDNLGLFYFMNTSSLTGPDVAMDASGKAFRYLSTAIESGSPAHDADAINALFEFFFDGRDNSSFYKSFFPHTHASSVADLSGLEYFSGTQMFDAIRLQLETWTDPRLKNSEFFKDSLDALLTSNTAPFPSKLRDAGPFQRFLKALSLGIADINLILEEIGDLLSIDECPEQFLELLAANIGWQFLTGDYDKWREQLANAVLMYKTKGSMLGLTAACRLMFPDEIFAASDVGESWESYVPKLLYYLVKTESFIAKEGLEFVGKEQAFEGSWPESVRYNAAPINYPNAADRNYRFLVDGILEQFHNKYKGIVIGGLDFRTLPLWTCLPSHPHPDTPGDTTPSPELHEGKGFYHRNYPSDPEGVNGFLVAVPPWEKYGFYKETEINHEKIDFFCNVLSGTRGDFGFEVPVDRVEGFKTLLVTAIDKVYALSGIPTLSENNKFRIFTESHELPPNYSSFVKYGHASALQDFDTWNTKGSFLFASFAASSIDYTVDGYDSFKNKAALETFHDVLRSFIPLHAVIRLLLYLDLEDTHTPSQKLCLFTDKCIETFNTEYLRSYRTNFWAGASGTGDLSTLFINSDGRVLPHTSSSINSFWQASATNLNRNASRRRDYRYSLPCFPYVRKGKGQPIALNHYGIATAAATVANDPYLYTWEYISKGFDYDTQTYRPASSTVWDSSGFFESSSCAIGGTESLGHELSTLYPSRAVGDADFDCSSLPIYRDTMKGIMEVITSRSIKENKFATLSDTAYRAFQLGTSLHESYPIYQNEFSGVLADITHPLHHYYGGHNFISYAFGPSVWNSDFYTKGVITSNTSSLPSAPYFFLRAGYEPEWEYIIGGTQAGGMKYRSRRGPVITVNDRTYFLEAPDNIPPSEAGVVRSRTELKTREIVSGVWFTQPYADSESFLVYNDNTPSATYNAWLGNSITMFNMDGHPLKVEIPFNPSDKGSGYYNKLRPQSQQAVDVFLRTQSNRKRQVLAMELITSGVMGDDESAVDWRFSWDDYMWKPNHHSFNEEEFIKRVSVDRDEKCILPHRAEFHTLDKFTEKSLPCKTPFKTGDVHTSGTGYILKVWNETLSPRGLNGVADDGLTLFEISVVDMVLNRSMNDFNASEVDIIYEFWDTLSFGNYSRNATRSVDAFEAQGGSRAEYVELLGFDINSSVVNNDNGRGEGLTIVSYEVGD